MNVDPRIIITMYTNTTTSGINIYKVLDFFEELMPDAPQTPIGLLALVNTPKFTEYLEEYIPQVKLLQKWDPNAQSIEQWEAESIALLGDIDLPKGSFVLNPEDANWDSLHEKMAEIKAVQGY